MIYTVMLIYLAVILYLEISHRRERESYFRLDIKDEEKHAHKRHFSPHRCALEKQRREEE